MGPSAVLAFGAQGWWGHQLLGLGLLQQRQPGGRGPVGPGGQLVLQWGPPGVEGVADVVVQQAAQGRHVDVSEPRQAPQEVRGVLVCAEQASKLGIEETFGHFPEEGREEQSNSVISPGSAFSYCHQMTPKSPFHREEMHVGPPRWSSG